MNSNQPFRPTPEQARHTAEAVQDQVAALRDAIEQCLLDEVHSSDVQIEILERFDSALTGADTAVGALVRYLRNNPQQHQQQTPQAQPQQQAPHAVPYAGPMTGRAW